MLKRLKKFIVLSIKIKPKQSFLFFLILFLFIIAWIPIFQNYFFYDDWSIFKIILASKNKLSMESFFLNEHFSPFLFFVKYLQIYIFRLNLFGFMFTQLFFYFICGALVYFFLNKFFKKGTSLILSFLFLISPAYYEILGWSATLGFLLAFTLTVLSMLFFDKFLELKKIKYLVLMLIFIILSCFSSGVGYLSFVFVFSFYFFIKKDFRNAMKEFKLEKIWFIPLSILFIAAVSLYIYLGEKVVIGSEINLNPYALIRYSVLGFFFGNFLPLLGTFSPKNQDFGKFLYPIDKLYLLNLIVFLSLTIFYFFKNIRKGFSIKSILLKKNFRLFFFALFILFFPYIFIAIPRTWVGIESFIFFGRYHLFSSIGLLLLMGMLLEKIEILLRNRWLKFSTILIILTCIYFLQIKNISGMNYFQDSKSRQFSNDYIFLREKAIFQGKNKFCQEKENMKLLENIITFGKPQIIFSPIPCPLDFWKENLDLFIFYQKYYP